MPHDVVEFNNREACNSGHAFSKLQRCPRDVADLRPINRTNP